MPNPFLLDTNSYYLLFQTPKSNPAIALEQKIKINGLTSFFIPQIVSMEIHSVIGRYRRGGNRLRHEACERHVLISNQQSRCTHTCVFPIQKRLKDKVYRDLLKLIEDINEARGDIQATILPLGSAQLLIAKNLLIVYADTFPIGSHDALIAACAINQNRTGGPPITLVTSDKGLKGVCAKEVVPVFDPANP